MQRNIAYRRMTAVERKRELIEAGIQCLGHGGISAFTIDNICREAQVSRGLINHHFKTKEDLLLQIYAAMTAHLVDEFPSDQADDVLQHVIDSNFDASTFRRSNLRAWLTVWGEIATNPELYALHEQRYQVYKSRIAAALHAVSQRGRLEIDAESLARQLIAMIDGLWLEYCLHSEDFTLEDARRDCYRLLSSRGIGFDRPSPEDEHDQV